MGVGAAFLLMARSKVEENENDEGNLVETMVEHWTHRLDVAEGLGFDPLKASSTKLSSGKPLLLRIRARGTTRTAWENSRVG